MFFVATDAHSKWPEIFEMSQTTTSKTITILRHLFARYGLPDQIVSDNGPQFTSAEFAEFLKKNGVRHIRSAPYHPSSNGAAERLVRTFKESLKAGERDGISLQHRLENFLVTYRTTPHSTTQVAPCTLFLGRSIRTRLDLVHPDIAQRVRSKQAKQKQQHDQHAQHREFVIGQRVMTRNYRPGPDWISGTITAQKGPLTFTVCIDNGQLWKRHVEQLKPLSLPLQTEFSKPDADSDDVQGPSPPISSEQPPHTTSSDTADPEKSDTAPSAQRYPQRVCHPPDRLMYCQF